MLTQTDEAELKKIVSQWGNMVTRSLKNNASKFQHGRKGMVIRKPSDIESKDEGKKRLAASISYKMKSLYGVPQYVSFRFERHGIFVQKGVSRGYEMSGGQVIRTAKRKPTKQRKPNDWLNSVIERNLPNLEAKLIERFADAVINVVTDKSKVK
jgi:hypothetical protein